MTKLHMMPPFVFLSYSHFDEALVKQLREDLSVQGITTWIDLKGIQPGTPDWEETIRIAIRDAYAVLFIASPSALNSLRVTDELHIAEMYQRQMYPVWVAGKHWMEAAPLGFGGSQYIDAREAHYQVAVQELGILLRKIESTFLLLPDTFKIKISPFSDLFTINKLRRSSAFISYSHKDKRYLEELQIHLAYYIRTERLNIWDDTKLLVGSNWRKEIKFAIQAAKVAILLISADFLASDFIASNELPPLLAAAKEEGATIICVILRPSAFKDTELAQFQVVNPPSKPLSKLAPAWREEIWNKVSEIVRDALKPQQL